VLSDDDRSITVGRNPHRGVFLERHRATINDPSARSSCAEIEYTYDVNVQAARQLSEQ
jgi:hypothetical protein